MKQILTILFSLVLVAQTYAPYAYAQEATDSAIAAQNSSVATSSANESTASGTLHTVSSTVQILPPSIQQDNPFIDNSTNTSVWGTGSSSITGLLNSTLGNSQTIDSAVRKQQMVVNQLGKKDFKSNEDVTLTIGNATPEDVGVSITDWAGNPVQNVLIEKTVVNSQVEVILHPQQFNFHPGKYTVHITTSDGTTSTQNFTWGVLALNMNKSLYLPGQTAAIAMAVLDDKGMTVCSATVQLDITSPTGTVTHESTTDNSITVNDQCHSHSMSLTPDYETHVTTGSVGNYAMTLTATTPSGTYSISDTLRVVAAVPFDIERVSATRLYPYNTYPMIFHITANQDFSGDVVETVPANFQVSPFASQSAHTFTDTKLVMPIPDMMTQFGVKTLSFSLPFSGNYQMVQGFGVALTDPQEAAYYAEFGLAGHDGLDFALPTGTPVLAADDGTVAMADINGVYGTTIVVRHAWGQSYYGHLSTMEVKVGDTVHTGQEIGLSGATGHVTGPHLHFGIKPLHPQMDNGFYGKVDPTPYLAALSGNSQVLGVTTSIVTQTQKLVTWHVSLKKGDDTDLAYNYQSPPQSPAFYTLGPLQFIDNGQSVQFQEARQWELAIDANSTAGPNNCSSSSNDNSTGAGGVLWSTVGSNNGACANAGTTTVASVTNSTTSTYLQMKGFGFSIPTTAKIIGIQFSIKKSGTTSGASHIVDTHVYLVKAGSTQTSGTDQASATAWPTTATATTYGSATAISWGGTWAPADINSTTFGVTIGAASSSTKSLSATITGFATATITYNQPPATPTSQSPTSGATTASNTVDLKMTATDPESDNVQYVINLYSGGTCSGSPTTYDQGTSQTGWTGTTTTCSVAGDCYTSGMQGDLNVTLTASTLYSWTVAARDPLGSNTSSSATSCINFTTGSGGGGGSTPTLDQLMRHGQWFTNGKAQPFTF